MVLPSTITLKDGTIKSRIVSQLEPGAGVTISRYHIHYVITEYGVAYLYGQPLETRVRELINIAHPKFMEELARQAFELWKIII